MGLKEFNEFRDVDFIWYFSTDPHKCLRTASVSLSFIVCMGTK